MKRFFRSEAGAAAVEFALVLPLLIAIVLGVVECSRLYNAQLSVSNAARQAARTLVVTGSAAQTQAAAIAGAPGLNPALTAANVSVPTPCPPPGGAATPAKVVTVSYTVTSITGFFFSTITLQGKGAMLCDN